MEIPARKDPAEAGDKERRFYVFAPASVVLALQAEGVARVTDPWRLGGAVLAQWVAAGCPDEIKPRDEGDRG
ncbi:hypothetical protein [Stutzerimonas nitrititolerans]|uniref:hypothetical protein n=1 Tax=Stutzerimonas nitrititolerans TaxID=2482751 RepID=UPI00289E607C|nr:hypothetical protein [Stutzerimonas nitrititolerans]